MSEVISRAGNDFVIEDEFTEAVAREINTEIGKMASNATWSVTFGSMVLADRGDGKIVLHYGGIEVKTWSDLAWVEALWYVLLDHQQQQDHDSPIVFALDYAKEILDLVAAHGNLPIARNVRPRLADDGKAIEV